MNATIAQAAACACQGNSNYAQATNRRNLRMENRFSKRKADWNAKAHNQDVWRKKIAARDWRVQTPFAFNDYLKCNLPNINESLLGLVQ